MNVNGIQIVIEDRLARTVERAKGEILADVKRAHIPYDVGSFAELHDYVDANYYGGAFEGEIDPSSDEQCAFWNRVQRELDAWIKAGGLPKAYEAWRDQPRIFVAGE